jgi:hypothetical protein
MDEAQIGVWFLVLPHISGLPVCSDFGPNHEQPSIPVLSLVLSVTASSGIRLLVAYSLTPSRLLSTTVPFLATHGDPNAHVCAPIHRWCLISHPYEGALWRTERKEQESKLINMMILRNSSSSRALLVQDPLPLQAAAEVSDGT